MNNLEFKYVSAENFMPFGTKIEIFFDKLGKIVSILGDNLDNTGSKNGVGKSSIMDIIVYTLYGKTIKGLTQDQVINNSVGKKMSTEVVIGDYRIIRSRKPNALRIFYKDKEETLGGIPATQAKIQEIFGLSYESFVSILFVTDNNNSAFLECNTATKRSIVENLINLTLYQEYTEKAKKQKQECQIQLNFNLKEYEKIQLESNTLKKRLVDLKTEELNWKNDKKQKISSILDSIKIKQNSLNTTNSGEELNNWNQAQEKIKEINESLVKNIKNQEILN